MDDYDELQSNESDEKHLLKDVRAAAGWRVAPRHLEVAVQALVEVGEEPKVERLAEVASAIRGERSQRQRRNADLWRLLGAQLAVRGKYSEPEAQQAFVGRAKALASDRVPDVDLLLVATALGSANHPQTPEITADVASWLIEQTGGEIDEAVIDDRLDQAVEAVMSARAEFAARRRKGRPPGR
jgi:hypothetical protein